MTETKKNIPPQKERDSYEEMLKNLNISDDKFVEWGLKEIKKLLPPIDQVEAEWNKLCKKINRKEPIANIDDIRKEKEELDENISKLNSEIEKSNTKIKNLDKKHGHYQRQCYEDKNREQKKEEEKNLVKNKEKLEKENQKLDKLKELFIFIRGYGRNKEDKVMRERLQKLYTKAGFNIIIEIDRTNNEEPTNLMNRMHKKYWKPNWSKKEPEEQKRIILKNYKLSHIWGFTKNICLFNCPWNIMLTPYVIDPFTGHESADTPLRDKLREKIKELINDKYNKFKTKYNDIWDEKKETFFNACDKLAKEAETDKEKKLYHSMKEEWVKLTDENMFSKKKKK